MKSVLTMNNVKVVLPGKFAAKFSHVDRINEDKFYKRLKIAMIIAIPIILVIAYYCQMNCDLGNVLG